MPIFEDEQKEYKFITKINQFLKDLKVQSRTKIDNKKSENIIILLAKKKKIVCLKLFLRVFIPQAKNSSFFNGSHINPI